MLVSLWEAENDWDVALHSKDENHPRGHILQPAGCLLYIYMGLGC